MKRITLHFFSIAFFLLFATTVVYSQAKRPNIVWVVSEDNSKHYSGLYEKEGAPMPNIAKLAKQGIVFNHAFSQAPVCSVARSTIISGCYAPRVGSQYHRREQLAPMPEGLEMFPYYLRQAGYYTSNNSKEDYNFIRSEGVWDESSKKASYTNRKEGQSFFHVQNFGITHEGRLHFTAENMAANPTKHDPDKVTPFACYPNTETFRYTHARYLDLHQNVDAAIGQFIEQLEADNLLDDTFIFYYGDHGGVLPGSKGYIYERGVHVPMVVYIPKNWKHLVPVSAGSRVDGFVQFVDLAPTVLNLAGVSIPKQIDGKAFLGKDIERANLEARNMTFTHADRFDEKYDLVRAIRKGKYKYMRNYQPFNFDGLHNFYRYRMLAYKEWRDLYHADKLTSEAAQFFESRAAETLFDIEKDPFELNNLATDPAYANTLKELRQALQNQVKGMPDLSFYPEPYFIEKGIANPVRFGQDNKAAIAKLVDIADLSLVSFAQAKRGINKALKSKDSWDRYWALIVCSSFGEEAAVFYKKAKKIAANDTENLVRMRAAEFLALTQQESPQRVLTECIEKARSHTEANLILNTVALLKDTALGYTIEFDAKLIKQEWLDAKPSLVFRRMEYLNGK